MLSRTANSIYWMSRYLERADNVARFMAVNSHLIMDMGLDREKAQWEPLVQASGDDEDFRTRYEAADERSVIRFLTFDQKNRNSILSCVAQARENARTLREVISSEMWEAINALYHLVKKHSRKRRLDDLDEFYKNVRTGNHLFLGLTADTMSHGQGWQFANIGRLLERADKTARILDVKYFTLRPSSESEALTSDTVEWGAVLKSVSGFEMYLKQFHHAEYRNVANFLIFDKHFPRSVLYSVSGAMESLDAILDMLSLDAPVRSEMAKLKDMLVQTDIDTVLANGLHEFIDVFQFNLNVVDDALYRTFFNVAPVDWDAERAPPT